MISLQKYFDQFHEAIKLDYENDDLRTSRDAIKSKLENSFKDYFKDPAVPTPTFFDQGSYALSTGIKPYENEICFDIDEGVKFNVSPLVYKDPVDFKKAIRDALKDHTDLGVTIKGPCVRVKYSNDKKEKYHVDLAIYATNGQTQRGSLLYLARGKEFSEEKEKYWENCRPEALIDLINNNFTNQKDRDQFRRIVRYLKRWKDIRFLPSGTSSPTGISLTITCAKYFHPVIGGDGIPNDLLAIQNLLSSILLNTQQYQLNGAIVKRFVCNLPVEPRNDLFRRMTDNQMANFLEELKRTLDLIGKLEQLQTENEACLSLAEIFGEDFPVPESKKIFVLVKKPNLGIRRYFESVPNYNLISPSFTLKAYVKLKNQKIPITSDRKVINSNQVLEFQSCFDGVDYNEIRWRVVNTGDHVEFLARKSGNELKFYRGKLKESEMIETESGAYKHVASKNQLITQETTQYTGKHWIECLAMLDGKCVAKSEPFYVNIYNSEFPNYV